MGRYGAQADAEQVADALSGAYRHRGHLGDARLAGLVAPMSAMRWPLLGVVAGGAALAAAVPET